MSVFHPESGAERRELYLEKNRFSPEVEKRLRQAFEIGQETIADVLNCPVASCRNPLSVSRQEDGYHLFCSNCGWKKVVK